MRIDKFFFLISIIICQHINHTTRNRSLSRITCFFTKMCSYCVSQETHGSVECGMQIRMHDIVTNSCHLIQSGERWRTVRLSNCKSNASPTCRPCESSASSLMHGFKRSIRRAPEQLDTDSDSLIRTSGACQHLICITSRPHRSRGAKFYCRVNWSIFRTANAKMNISP